MEKNEKLLRYSMQLAYLHTLLSAKLITESEYSRIKKKLQKDYKVWSGTPSTITYGLNLPVT